MLADCDVLTRTVAERSSKFQQAGGLVIGDERTCPAIRPDILLPICTRTGRAPRTRPRCKSSPPTCGPSSILATGGGRYDQREIIHHRL